MTSTSVAVPARSIAHPEAAPRQRLALILILGLLIALGPFTIDLYLPALPTITDDLGTTDAAVQLTLTGTLLGLGVGQLIIGPLSDALGRRRPLLVGIAVHVVASLLCVVSTQVVVLGVLRVLEGLGAAAASVVAVAVVRDLYTGLSAARALSRLILVLGVSPVLAPTVGGELLRWTDWRGIFLALALIGVACALIARLGLPETLPIERRLHGGIRRSVGAYRGLVRDRTFVGLVLVAGLAMAAVFAYVAGSSFVLQDQYGLSEQQFGLAFAVNAVALVGAPQLNVVLLRRHTPQRVLTVALGVGVALSLVLLAVALTGAGGLAGLLVPLFLVLAATGFVAPNAPALALSRHGHVAGTAAALLGAVQFGVGALAAPVVGAVGNDAVAVAVVVVGSMVAATLVLLAVVRPSRLAGLEASKPVAVAH